MFCCSYNHNGRKCNCKAEGEKIRKYIKALKAYNNIIKEEK